MDTLTVVFLSIQNFFFVCSIGILLVLFHSSKVIGVSIQIYLGINIVSDVSHSRILTIQTIVGNKTDTEFIKTMVKYIK